MTNALPSNDSGVRSTWAMALPAVIQLTSPASTTWSEPRLSLCWSFSFEQVGEGGQADMRMLADIHASPGRVGGLQHVIEEHERPDAAAFGGRQWAKNRLAFDIFGAGANGQGVVMLSSRLNNGCTKHNPSPADAADTP
nr:hypothetical protein GCM10020185_57210 [Pseudomonas brassicacearum subsp. brassicacearum]